MVALLRGVNVGGKSSLSMSDLRAVAESCGYEHVRTYIQSGNLVFEAPARATSATVAKQLELAIADATVVEPEVVARTRAELAAAVDGNPFASRGEDPAHLHVVFTTGQAKASLGSIDLAGYAPEEAAAVGQHLYLFLPSGMGRSKLAADLSRRRGSTGTARNWRTVTKLLGMAGELG
jgi:uncharacterized protein (DUF1697 family)